MVSIRHTISNTSSHLSKPLGDYSNRANYNKYHRDSHGSQLS